MNKIIWEEIINYKGQYRISSDGQVFSVKRDIIMKPQTDKDGYLYISLCFDGIKQKHKIHRLVAEAFIPNLNNLPEVNHLDFNRQNNNINNLEWSTCKDNIRHSSTKGRYSNNYGSKHWLHKVVQQIDATTNKIIAEYFGTREAERITSICHSSIGKVCNQKAKLAGGYIWRYKCD